jgi:hypothetical protein
VQEVEVEAIGSETFQAGLAGALDPATPRVLLVDLADQEGLVTNAEEGLSN